MYNNENIVYLKICSLFFIDVKNASYFYFISNYHNKLCFYYVTLLLSLLLYYFHCRGYRYIDTYKCIKCSRKPICKRIMFNHTLARKELNSKIHKNS